ncbi:BCL2 modifying factor 2 isoform X2 [Trichomycterus rosablanca]|uniref:BCL2 modifying factor 2 isoform X2 n=1 Tax=Trichomycterus rosablanca TaxID=2290929 RepID=UPI002F360DAD
MEDDEEDSPLSSGDAEFVPHCPAVAEDLGDEEQQDEGKMEEEEEEDQERMNVEVQIGRKLRQIGDQFQEEHMQLFVQYQRDQLPMWWRLTTRLYNFLFVREAFRPGGGH